jgi:hypothetical protein
MPDFAGALEERYRQLGLLGPICPHCEAKTVEALENGALGCSTCFKMWEPPCPHCGGTGVAKFNACGKDVDMPDCGQCAGTGTL